MKKPKSIHFVGIKGVGMTPLAIIAKEAGIRVSGCDIADVFITDKALQKSGISPVVGFSSDHIHNIDLLITTGAHGGFDHKEVVTAKEKNIPVLTQGQAVGEFMKGEILGRTDMRGISIAGSHGKTTTTAMLATIFSKSGLAPSYLIGTGEIASLEGPGHYGKGKYFIAEADEYATEPTYDKTPKFLWQHPKIAIITNVELDHPDLYPTVDAIGESFLSFAKNTAEDGVLIACGDDPESRKLLKAYTGRVITFGYGLQNDFVITKTSVSSDRTFFWVEGEGASLGEFMMQVAGEHNALNALAAIIASLEAGLPIEKIKESLALFKGSKRRLEYLGQLVHGALLYDDYAHHPTEIKKTLQTIRLMYPKKELVCVFQPHTYSRTKILFEDFIHSFVDANAVIISDIYASLRENPDSTVSSRHLIQAMNRFHKNALYLASLGDVLEYITKKNFTEKTVVVIMGAGDIYKIASKLVKTN